MNDPKKLASKGRYGDTMLAHINPEEAALLKARGGSGTINPKTGLPEFYGYYQYNQPNQATLDAQKAAEKAATKKAAGPQYIPRGQRVQTGPQPAANFTPNAANMDLVNRAYGNIGRASVGTNLNQIDQGGQNYWMNQLNSGAISPQDFAGIFSKAAQAAQPETANMYQNQALSQIRGARPSGEAQQFYQPVYQPQYQNYNSSAQPVMNQQTGQPSSGNVLTPAIARTLMQMAETTGLPKSESDKYGGYAAIKALYNAGGGSSAQPGQQQQMQQQAQFNPYTNSFGATGGAFPTQTPFSYQQPAAQLQNPFSYQTTTGQPNRDYGLAYSKPMQLPQYVYDTIRDVDSYQSQPVQAYQSTRPAPITSSGPSKAIVGRSSQVRGTPNVMAAPVTKAKGGIASLLKKHK